MPKAWVVLVVTGGILGGFVGPSLGMYAQSIDSSRDTWLAAGISVLGSSLVVIAAWLKPTPRAESIHKAGDEKPAPTENRDS